MNADAALADWLQSGAKIDLPNDEAVAKRRREFSARFVAAINPEDDLGPTEEAHQLAIMQLVVSVHDELRAFGIEEYDAVWGTLSAPVRSALKKYIARGA